MGLTPDLLFIRYWADRLMAFLKPAKQISLGGRQAYVSSLLYMCFADASRLFCVRLHHSSLFPFFLSFFRSYMSYLLIRSNINYCIMLPPYTDSNCLTSLVELNDYRGVLDVT